MATSTQTQTANGVDHTQQLVSDLEGTHALPLWTQMAKYNPPAPNPKAIPHLWKYDEIKPHLIRAGELITEKQAERRVLMLINPALAAPCSTDTLYAGLQLVMPNETAPAHRHTAFAMRFIIEGQGGFTAVHGKRITMKRGDVILTPSWNWHDHGKDGSGPMIWLDGLDLPNFQYFPVHFVEHYQDPRYPAEMVDSATSPIVFQWSEMQKRLDEATGEWASMPYLRKNGQEGKAIMAVAEAYGATFSGADIPTVSLRLGGSAERLNAGASSPAVRETASSIYHVIEGSGYTEIDGKRVAWKQNDTFCIPAWYSYQHFADSGSTVYLYRFDDKPMLKALGFYRLAGEDSEKYVAEQ